MPINSASISALRVARNVKRRRRAEGGAIYDPMSGIRIGGESSDEPAPESQGTLSRTLSRLTGTQFGEPRYQLWPEKMIRSGATLAGDVLSGSQAVLPPGLRREDYTDAPAPSEPTQDSTWLGRSLGIPPVQAQPNDPMMERAQDMAGMAGGQTLLAGAAERAPVAQRVLVAAADSQAIGVPLAALERLDADAFKKGYGKVEMVPVDSIRPRSENTAMIEKFKKLDADGQASFEAAYPGERYEPHPGDMRYKVDEMRQALQRGEELPPLVVRRDGLIEDGENRWNAYKAAGIGMVPVRRLLSDSTAPGAPLAAVEHMNPKDVWWHGSPSGDLRGGPTGLHFGTKEAAQQALEARIGIPADGRGWDGTRPYGETLLAGQETLRKMDPRGYNRTGYNVDAPLHDYYPTKLPNYGDGSPVPFDAKPILAPYKLTGEMSNARSSPHEDFRANGYMAGQLKRGSAKKGYYYKNVGEDSGSTSITVPNERHVQRLLEDSAVAGAALAASQNFSDADIAALAAAAQESGKRQKKSAMPPPERMAGGMVANPAMDVARNIKRAKGGKVHVGPIVGNTGGRADKVPMEVPNGAYILTADLVSGLGEGNTDAGMLKLAKMFPKSKPSLMRKLRRHTVPIRAAHGEFCVSPADIIDRFGDLDHGHKSLDAWQTHERQQLIKTLGKLAPPATD